VVDFKAPKKGGLSVADAADIFVEVALSCRKDATPDSSSSDNSRGSGSSSCGSSKGGPKGEPRPVVDPTQAEVRVIRVALTALKDVSAVRIHLPRDLTSPESRTGVSKTIGEVSRRLAKVNMHPLDPVTDMKVVGSDLDALLERKALLEKRRVESPVTQWPDHDEKLARYAEKHALSESAKALRKAAKQATAPAMKDAMKRMQRVLKRLGHVHPSTGVIETKGRVACEVNTADELLVTELVFTGAFIELPDAETAALLSCLVSEFKHVFLSI
jgi:ATP-dependent RNA helicase DOB1